MNSSWISLIVLAAILFGVAYIGLSAVGLLPDTMRNFVDFLQANLMLFSVLFIFSISAYVLILFKSKGQGRRR